MSKDYVVILVKEPKDGYDIDDMAAQVFMRFHEQPADDFLDRIAAANPGKRVYSLLGAASWHLKEK